MADDIKKDLPEEEELPEGIIELTDEDGVTTQFEYLATIEYEDELYVALMDAAEAEADDEEAEVMILKIEQDENGDDVYVTVDDEDVGQAVFEKFIEMMDEEDEE